MACGKAVSDVTRAEAFFLPVHLVTHTPLSVAYIINTFIKKGGGAINGGSVASLLIAAAVELERKRRGEKKRKLLALD